MTKRRVLEACKRVATQRAKHQAAADDCLADLRTLWVKAAALGIPSHEVADVSGVKPASVRMAWGNGKRSA